jgi:hypothetical protein
MEEEIYGSHNSTNHTQTRPEAQQASHTIIIITLNTASTNHPPAFNYEV